MAKKSFLTIVLDFIALFLETLLSSASSRRFRYSSTDDDEEETFRNSNGGASDSSKIKAALNYFELADSNDAAALRETIKKKYRKLSLLHHPDRNDNSDESVKEMQKVNHHYNLLIEELDRREGIVHEEEDEVEPSEPEQARPESTSSTERNAREQSKNKKGKGRKAKNKQSKASREKARRRRREAHARSEQEKEQEKEWQEIQHQQQQINNLKRKMVHKVRRERTRHNLNTEEGRKRANYKFEEAMGFSQDDIPEATVISMPSSVGEDERAASMHDIDDDDDHGTTEPESPAASSPSASDFDAGSTEKEKPTNLIMKYCMDDIAVALRLQLPDAAMETIQKRISNRIYEKLLSLKKAGRESDFEWAATTATTEFLQNPLDEDGNTILHYAAYYESMDVISMVYFYACKCDALPDTFLQENRYGHIPLDFCQCCVKNDALPDRMKTLTEAARAAQPTVTNSVQRLKTILTNFDWVSVLNEAASVCLGVGMFDVRFFVAVIVTMLHLWSAEGGAPEWRAATLLAWHTSWWVLKSIIGWIPFTWYSALALLLLTPLLLCARLDHLAYVVFFVPTVTTGVALLVTSLFRIPARLRKHHLDDVCYIVILWIGALLAGWCLSGLWYRFSKLVAWSFALPGRVWNKLGLLVVGGDGEGSAVKSGRSEGLQRALDLHRQALMEGEDADDLEF